MVRNGAAAGGAVPRRLGPDLERRRARAARPRLPPAVRAEPPLLRQLHRPAAATRTSPSSAPPRPTPPTPASERTLLRRGAALREPQRRRARLRQRRLTSTSASATAAPAATRSATARGSTRCSARCCGSTWTAARPTRCPPTTRSARPRGRGPRSGPTACATRSASPSTARPATSTSATSARAAVEEIDVGPPPRRGRARTTAGTSPRARPCYQPPSGCDTTGITLPVYEYDARRTGCSVTGGVVYRGCRMPELAGTLLLRRLLQRLRPLVPLSRAARRRTCATGRRPRGHQLGHGLRRRRRRRGVRGGLRRRGLPARARRLRSRRGRIALST